MSAKFIFVKYTGKDADFGTEVSSIGLKRVDAAVPAVYGNPVVPGNDISDALTYPVYLPNDPEGFSYSFESAFKMKLINPPDNQLSNIRIYPSGQAPENSSTQLFIGSTTRYFRPTNAKSNIATYNIWSFSKENPFNVPVSGITGTKLNPQISISTFNISLGDIGSGNVIYINGERQPLIQLVQPRVNIVDRIYTLVNNSNNRISLNVFNKVDNTLVSHPSIVKSLVDNKEVLTITASQSLLTSYPSGLLYGSDDVSIGGELNWIDIDGDPMTVEIYDVNVLFDISGKPYYSFNDMAKYIINFELNKKYVFNNHSGDEYPLRFLSNNWSEAVEENIIVCDGIEIQNGGTVNEIITVDPRKVMNAGYTIESYQSVNHNYVGNNVTHDQVEYVGNYNINTVGGGTNPLAAGETDYIYLQLEVSGKANTGNIMPNLVIEYDEN